MVRSAWHGCSSNTSACPSAGVQGTPRHRPHERSALSTAPRDTHPQAPTATGAEARLRAVIDSALDAVVTTDADSVITGWSAHAATMFGWTAEEALGRTLNETIIPPQHREAHRAGVQRYLRTGEPRI